MRVKQVRAYEQFKIHLFISIYRNWLINHTMMVFMFNVHGFSEKKNVWWNKPVVGNHFITASISQSNKILDHQILMMKFLRHWEFISFITIHLLTKEQTLETNKYCVSQTLSFFLIIFKSLECMKVQNLCKSKLKSFS